MFKNSSWYLFKEGPHLVLNFRTFEQPGQLSAVIQYLIETGRFFGSGGSQWKISVQSTLAVLLFGLMV